MGTLDTIAHVLCGHCIQNDWVSRAMNLHQSLCEVWTFLCTNYLMIQKPQLWATGDWQLHHDNVPTHASHLLQSVLAKHLITQMTQPRYSSDLVPCNFWLFPKLKSHLKGKRFQTVNEIQENTTGQLLATGRTVWTPKMPTLKGIEASLSCVQCILYLW